jgi:hypothetical protein
MESQSQPIMDGVGGRSRIDDNDGSGWCGPG